MVYILTIGIPDKIPPVLIAYIPIIIIVLAVVIIFFLVDPYHLFQVFMLYIHSSINNRYDHRRGFASFQQFVGFLRTDAHDTIGLVIQIIPIGRRSIFLVLGKTHERQYPQP